MRRQTILYIVLSIMAVVCSSIALVRFTNASPLAFKVKEGIHLGNRLGGWTNNLLALIDGDQSGGIWPGAVVFLSNQVYTTSRDPNTCRIKTGAADTTISNATIKNYLQRASQQTSPVRIYIRLYPSPGNFEDDGTLAIGPIDPFTGFCFPGAKRPAQDLGDEMIAIHNYNQANGITETGFAPANEPNLEWYGYQTSNPVKVDKLKAWQEMNNYFGQVWLGVPLAVKVMASPMVQSLYAENNFTDANAIAPDRFGTTTVCSDMRLEDGQTTGYGRMQEMIQYRSDLISWHNYSRIGFESYGPCQLNNQPYGLHVSYYFPDWMKTTIAIKGGVIPEHDLFSYKPTPQSIGQDPWTVFQDKDACGGKATATSLRKWIEAEQYAQRVVVWLLNDNVNSSSDDHNWHEAYRDSSGSNTVRAWFNQWWLTGEASVRSCMYLPLILR